MLRKIRTRTAAVIAITITGLGVITGAAYAATTGPGQQAASSRHAPVDLDPFTPPGFFLDSASANPTARVSGIAFRIIDLGVTPHAVYDCAFTVPVLQAGGSYTPRAVCTKH